MRDTDELHDALLTAVALPAAECEPWRNWLDELARAGRATQARGAGPALWVSAERWPVVRAGIPDATPANALAAVEQTVPSASDAWIALVRGRLEVRGPQTAEEIAGALGLPESAVTAALDALEGEGFALKGRFRPSLAGAEPEWCERRLLARIHRLTLDGLRRQIEPVPVDVFLRFLLAHQHVASGHRLRGREGVVSAIEQLQGFEVPAGAWEPDVLSARVQGYGAAMLDELCLSGTVAWGRLNPPRRAEDAGPGSGSLTRVVPIALVLRRELGWLLAPDRFDASPFARSGAGRVLEHLRGRGALFYQDLLASAGMLPAQLEDSLSELAALGLAAADGFEAIRSLVSPRRARVQDARRRRGRGHAVQAPAVARGGRWAVFPGVPAAAAGRLEAWTRQLLARYGVLMRDLLRLEPAAPAWSELLPLLRRLEARGEARGGRFVSGCGGEQYSLPGAVERLREARDSMEPAAPASRHALGGEWLVLGAADPCNLTGVLLPGARVAATRANRLLLRGGRIVASLQGGKVATHAEDVVVEEARRRLQSRAT
ncbi:MAG: hypothetical protein HY303_19965 [Candidatus Wallbacteria bacterium]|nr:hypothetical protein [Candidatus Wallbacteria bacterium]